MLLSSFNHSVTQETAEVLKKTYEYIVSSIEDIKKLKDGIHKLEMIHENAYVSVMEYDTKDDPFWEAHQKYIDIQIVFEGSEGFEIGDIDKLEKKGEYDSEKDLQVLTGHGNVFLTLHPNSMLVLYPKDAHRVGLHPKEGKKLIFCLIFYWLFATTLLLHGNF